MGALLIALFGLWILRLVLLRWFSEGITGLVLVLLVIGTNYLDYSAINGAMTHNTKSGVAHFAAEPAGIPALAAVFAVLTGLAGAVSAKYLFDALRIHDPVLRGFALGTAAHGIGAARAMQVHPAAGAYAALALGLQVLLAAPLMPLARDLFGQLF